ncbi:MAG: hypothetical protein K2X32_09950 [Phycisphaerales bacterium]|nr:hypothetical protein [Phycisphaerales bacterium]
MSDADCAVALSEHNARAIANHLAQAGVLSVAVSPDGGEYKARETDLPRVLGAMREGQSLVGVAGGGTSARGGSAAGQTGRLISVQRERDRWLLSDEPAALARLQKRIKEQL